MQTVLIKSKVREKYKVTNPSICKSQILMRDYQFEESKVVMQELIEDVASRLRAEKKLARTIHFSFSVMLKVVAYISNILWRILQI